MHGSAPVTTVESGMKGTNSSLPVPIPGPADLDGKVGDTIEATPIPLPHPGLGGDTIEATPITLPDEAEVACDGSSKEPAYQMGKGPVGTAEVPLPGTAGETGITAEDDRETPVASRSAAGKTGNKGTTGTLPTPIPEPANLDGKGGDISDSLGKGPGGRTEAPLPGTAGETGISSEDDWEAPVA